MSAWRPATMPWPLTTCGRWWSQIRPRANLRLAHAAVGSAETVVELFSRVRPGARRPTRIRRPRRRSCDSTRPPSTPRRWPPTDLVCLDHPGKLTDDAIKVLSGSLRRGRPVLYVAGETIDATNLKRLADASGTGLHMPVEFTPPPAGIERAKNLFLRSVRSDEPPFSAFGDTLADFVNSARFGGGLDLPAAGRRTAGRCAGHVQRRLGVSGLYRLRSRCAGRAKRRPGRVGVAWQVDRSCSWCRPWPIGS